MSPMDEDEEDALGEVDGGYLRMASLAGYDHCILHGLRTSTTYHLDFGVNADFITYWASNVIPTGRTTK